MPIEESEHSSVILGPQGWVAMDDFDNPRQENWID